MVFPHSGKRRRGKRFQHGNRCNQFKGLNHQIIKEKCITLERESIRPRMSQWNKEDAEAAIELEKQYQNRFSNQYILRFPDPFVDKSIIQKFSSAIVDIRVQFPLLPRFVYIQLNPNANVDEVRETINQTPFGAGYLKLEEKVTRTNEITSPEDIDPFTIFIGNIPSTTTVQSIKRLVPLATKVDVGHSKKHRYGRYAFIKFRSAEDARTTYKDLRRVDGQATDLFVRFRRNRGAFGEVKRNVPVVDLTKGDDRIKQEPCEVVEEKEVTQPIDWDKVRELEMQRYGDIKPDLSKLPAFPESLLYSNPLQTETSSRNSVFNDLEELFNEINCEFNYTFDCDLDI